MNTEINNSDIQDESTEPSVRKQEWTATLKSMSTTAVLLGATLIVLSVLHPDLILRNNTPTGGDMGAHVWGPAYLRDVLLPIGDSLVGAWTGTQGCRCIASTWLCQH